MIADIDCRVQYQWTYSFGSRCRVEDDARWQTESREGTISARDIRSRGAYTNFEWVRNRVGTAGQPPWRPIEMEFDRASLPFAPFPPFTPRLSPFIHLPIRRTAAAAIKRQRQVPEWRSAADAQCDPPPRVQSKRARQQSGTFDEARAFYLRLFIYLFALRIFAIPLEHVVSNEICPRNFFVVGSSLEEGGRTVIGELHSFHLQRIKLRKISLLVLLWREACNYSANFVAGKFIPSLDLAYTRHSCETTSFSSSTIKFPIFLLVSSLYLEISIFDSTSQRSLHRWRDEISDSVLIFFFFK